MSKCLVVPLVLLSVVAVRGDIITLQPGSADSNEILAFIGDPDTNYNNFGIVACEASGGADGLIEGFLEFTELDH